jgi:hypothetical protein
MGKVRSQSNDGHPISREFYRISGERSSEQFLLPGWNSNLLWILRVVDEEQKSLASAGAHGYFDT